MNVDVMLVLYDQPSEKYYMFKKKGEDRYSNIRTKANGEPAHAAVAGSEWEAVG